MPLTSRTFVTCLLALAGCQTVEQHRADDYDFAGIASFAFKEPPRYAAVPEPYEQSLPSELEMHVREAFQARDVSSVPKIRAQVVVSAKLDVTTRTVNNDPNYSQYAMEEFEEGVLQLQVYDRLSRQLVWGGEATRRLRTKALAFSGLVPKWKETGARRVWPLEQMVEEIFAALPGR